MVRRCARAARAAADVLRTGPPALGDVRLRHVGHRLPERVGRLGVAEVALVFVVADAIVGEIVVGSVVVADVVVELVVAVFAAGRSVAMAASSASRDARYAAGTTCSTCAA